jgi:hypothetical protein
LNQTMLLLSRPVCWKQSRISANTTIDGLVFG